MVIQCPQCEKKYRVVEEEVPTSGAAVRCPKCRNIFTIYKQVSPIELVPYEGEAREEAFRPSEPPVREEPIRKGVEKFRETLSPPPLAPPPIKEAEKEVSVGIKDERFNEAKQLARSLVKDIVLYHKERVEEGIRKGTLIQLVGDEIRKSWSFYREQIPADVLKSSDYFKEALNDILAKGKKIFT